MVNVLLVLGTFVGFPLYLVVHFGKKEGKKAVRATAREWQHGKDDELKAIEARERALDKAFHSGRVSRETFIENKYNPAGGKHVRVITENKF